MGYEKTNWQDSPSTETPINATNLNHMEGGIEAANKNTDNMADIFSTTAIYAKGDLCIYDNILYKFTAAKTAGAWDSTVVVATTVGDEIAEQNSNLGGVKFGIDSSGNYGYIKDGADAVVPFRRYEPLYFRAGAGSDATWIPTFGKKIRIYTTYGNGDENGTNELNRYQYYGENALNSTNGTRIYQTNPVTGRIFYGMTCASIDIDASNYEYLRMYRSSGSIMISYEYL